MRKTIFTILSLASIAAGAYFSFGADEPSYAMTGIWLTFSLFTFSLGWPEIAESISFLGNNIKLREVKTAIDELKQLAEVFSISTLEMMQGGSRWSGLREEEKEKTYHDIEKMLKGLGFSDAEIQKIQSGWHRWVEVDYALAIILPRSSIAHPEVPKPLQEQWHKIYGEIKETIPSLTPQKIRDLFASINCCTPKIEAALKDFEYYVIHKKHRNHLNWERRNDWFRTI